MAHVPSVRSVCLIKEKFTIKIIENGRCHIIKNGQNQIEN